MSDNKRQLTLDIIDDSEINDSDIPDSVMNSTQPKSKGREKKNVGQ